MTALGETIAAQADALRRVLVVSIDRAVAELEPAERVWLVGTGSSQHAAEIGGWLFGAGAREVQVRSAASFAWGSHRLSSRDGVVVISHTTETAFARRARREALDRGAHVVSITAVGKGWPEAIETVAAERSETYTLAYTAPLLVLARLALELGEADFTSVELDEVPDRVQTAASESPVLEKPPARLTVLAGVGPGAITAREGALKLREAARLPAEGYEAEYLLHGSAVPLGRGDALIAVGSAQDPAGLLAGLSRASATEGLSTAELAAPAGMHPVLAQLPLVVPLQHLADRFARARGVDPDRVIVGAWEEAELWSAGGPGGEE